MHKRDSVFPGEACDEALWVSHTLIQSLTLVTKCPENICLQVCQEARFPAACKASPVENPARIPALTGAKAPKKDNNSVQSSRFISLHSLQRGRQNPWTKSAKETKDSKINEKMKMRDDAWAETNAYTSEKTETHTNRFLTHTHTQIRKIRHWIDLCSTQIQFNLIHLNSMRLVLSSYRTLLNLSYRAINHSRSSRTSEPDSFRIKSWSQSPEKTNWSHTQIQFTQ